MSEALRIRAPYFNDLGPATYSLGAPVENNVIQIGMIGQYEKARLKLTVSDELVSIAREDGANLAVETRVTQSAPKIAVFGQPIARLLLKQDAEDNDFWLPVYGNVEGLVIANDEGLQEFVSTVSHRAMHKKIDAAQLGKSQTAQAA